MFVETIFFVTASAILLWKKMFDNEKIHRVFELRGLFDMESNTNIYRSLSFEIKC